MSEYRVNLVWRRDRSDFEYKTYSINHFWKFKNGLEIEASASSLFWGDASKIDPEEAFVASLSSCHMLTFLAICAHKRLMVASYEDHAVGYLEKNGDGKLIINRVDLHLKIEFDNNTPVSNDRSHHDCFIANSVKTEIKTIIET